MPVSARHCDEAKLSALSSVNEIRSESNPNGNLGTRYRGVEVEHFSKRARNRIPLAWGHMFNSQVLPPSGRMGCKPAILRSNVYQLTEIVHVINSEWAVIGDNEGGREGIVQIQGLILGYRYFWNQRKIAARDP